MKWDVWIMIYSFTLVLTKANPPPPYLPPVICDHYVELTSVPQVAQV